MSQARTLSDQAFCGWCGLSLINKTSMSTTCSGCGYVDYINPKGVTSTIVTHDGSVLLLKRGIDPKKGSYDLPGGFMDSTDDSIEDASAREVQEELRLTKEELGQLKYFGSSITEYEWQNTVLKNIAFYTTCELNKKDIDLDESENTDYIWIKEADLPSTNLAWQSDRKMLNKYFKENR